jgi:hypothetical protein
VALTNEGEFTLVLLSVTEPVRSNQHDCRLGCANGLFERPNPRQPWRQIAAIKERLQTLGAQDRINVRRMAPV